jgi:hypothetical protein
MSFQELDPGIERLHFQAVKNYLINTGWQRIHPDIENIMLFDRPEDDQNQLILPTNTEFADFSVRTKELILSLAQFENRSPLQILNDLLTDPSDIVRFRIINNSTTSGTIPLKEGFDLLQAAGKAIYTAACDIIQPEAYHRRLALKQADEFINSCRLGQTEHGSFVATVICPFLTEDLEEPLSLFARNQQEEFNSSFTRQVTHKLMSSLSQLKRAVENDAANELIAETQNHINTNLISGNFVESIIELNASLEDTDIEISVSTSPNAPALHFNAPPRIRLSRGHRSGLEYVARQLKPANLNTTEDYFYGRISETKAEPSVDSRSDGEVLLVFLDSYDKPLKAWVKLNNDLYNRALDAHRDGRMIGIKGTLHSLRRSNSITNVREFKILD